MHDLLKSWGYLVGWPASPTKGRCFLLREGYSGKMCQHADSLCWLLAPNLALAMAHSVLRRLHSVLPLLCSTDDEAMATEVTPPASAELTELGKCLMNQEVRVHALTSTILPGVSGAARCCYSYLGWWSIPQCENLCLGTCMCFKGLVNGCRSTREMGAGIQYNMQLWS